VIINALIVLAADEDQRTEMSRLIDDAGPIAGLFVLGLGIALFFLWRSLNKQVKRIDPSLPEGPHDLEQEEDRQLTERAVERGEDAQDEPRG
jgi:hypothetical protein